MGTRFPRLERICQLCATGAPGDEKHIIFECPELQCFREVCFHLFQGPETMLTFMWQDDLIGVAKYIDAFLNRVKPPSSSASDQPGVAGRNIT